MKWRSCEYQKHENYEKDNWKIQVKVWVTKF